MASNRSRSYYVFVTATLVIASDEESQAEISDNEVDLLLSDGEKNKSITYITTTVMMRKVKQPG